MWTEAAVLAELLQFNDMPRIEEIIKLADAHAAIYVLNGYEYAAVNIDPDGLPTEVAREIRRQVLWPR